MSRFARRQRRTKRNIRCCGECGNPLRHNRNPYNPGVFCNTAWCSQSGGKPLPADMLRDFPLVYA